MSITVTQASEARFHILCSETERAWVEILAYRLGCSKAEVVSMVVVQGLIELMGKLGEPTLTFKKGGG